MNKRRRTPSVASRSVDDDTESDSQSTGFMETTRKRRKLDPLDLMQTIYETVRNFKKEDGTLLCDAFIRVPKRRQEPGYHDVVTNPIDLLRIQQKLKTEEYDDVEEMQTDMELLINNAKSFYKRTSQEYKDANELWDLFLQTKTRVFEPNEDVPNDNKGKVVVKAGRGRPRLKQDPVEMEESSTESWSNSNDEELNLCEDLFAAVVNATDGDRPLHLVFQLLPSKKRYPNYYDVIDNPIDLRTIARKIQDGKYASLNEMEKDLLLMTKNACIFNEPGSQIYKDAKMLKKIIASRRVEIEHGRGNQEKKRERIRNKRQRGSLQSLSAITAALQSEEEDSDAEDDVADEQVDDVADDQVDDEDTDNPRWQLYNAVRTYTNSQGVCLAEPFLKLPSKRYAPTYWKEVRNHISLFSIRKKLNNGHYGTVSEVAGDLNIVFENAKKVNKPDTRVYKDAVKLQKVMQAKVQELLDSQLEYSDSDEDSDEPSTKRAKPSKALTRGKYLNNLPLKRRLYSLCKCLMDYVTEDGRQPMLMFMEKPSKKHYPDYYDVIQEPIDMLTIEGNIRAEKYANEEDILKDFQLMFRNCREYNEDGSLIYQDATTLEKVLMDHMKEGPVEKRTPKLLSQTPSPTVIKPRRPLPPTPTMAKMRSLFNTIKEYRDPKGRQLSVIFNKLPSKIEYPDYYEVIKKPINLEIISQKLKGNCYESLEDLISDFILMFDNACKYNEPDSQIYKDALVLQKVTLQTKMQLREDEDTVPDVPAAVQELLTSLFTSVYNHQDEEGRCFSDSMAELAEHDEVDGKKTRALSLDLIKRRLDTGQYRRLDVFQDDMFSCLERARRLSRTDSQVFEDSIELQTFFISQRDELCRNGDLLYSPAALSYTVSQLSESVNRLRDEKAIEERVEGAIKEEEVETTDTNDVTAQMPDSIMKEPEQEQDEDDDSTSASGQTSTHNVGDVDNAMSFNQQVYRIGDFVYAEPKERGMEWIIFEIQRLWVNQENQQMMYGNQYYRPSETYHVTTRKFLENEVFKTDQHMPLPLSSIKGRCAVLSVKDYFRFRPEGFEDKDVYVCESRYATKPKMFKKIKSWPPSLTNVCKLVEREEPLEPKRTVSVFRDRVEKHKEEIAELEEQERLVEKEKPNVMEAISSTEDGIVYYKQLNTSHCLIRTGDCVYLRNDNKNTSRTLICQINRIWMNENGDAFIHGPWLVLPADIPHPPNRLFYKQEILLSSLENTNDAAQISGKCAVLEHSDYTSSRPTEIPENDVYICESMFDEPRQQIVELPKDGLKKLNQNKEPVHQDEIYFFRRLINPAKVNAFGELLPGPSNTSVTSSATISGAASTARPSPEKSAQQSSVQNEVNFQSCQTSMVKVELVDANTEDSMDGGPPSVCSSDMGAPSTPNSTSNAHVSSFRKKKFSNLGFKTKQVTGYILYASSVRRTVTEENPHCSFGEISRLVGHEWKQLPSTEKNFWEEKAMRVNEEAVAKAEREAGLPQATPVSGNAIPAVVWECMWEECDYMFEEQSDCMDHAIADSTGHVCSTFNSQPNRQKGEYQCRWKDCPRIKRQAVPFPSLHRLIRHVKEVHIMKSPGRKIAPSQRSKMSIQNFVFSSRKPRVRTTTPSTDTPKPALPVATSDQSNATPAIMPATVPTTPETQSPQTQTAIIVKPKPTEPLFVVVPPRPHRVLHSDIYVRYIENLTSDKATQVGSWESQLYAAKDSVPVPESQKLPLHWLENGVGSHGNVLNALWALRDYMMKDALNISKRITN